MPGAAGRILRLKEAISLHPVWKGAVSFGLVNIPVRLYAATESKEIHFNQLHRECRTPINYRKFCPACDREVTADELVRGYQVEKGQYVVLEDEDLAELPLGTLHTFQILNFVELREIDPIYLQKSYFLAPAEYGRKPYRLLHQALRETGRVAVGKVVLRQKENLACLRPYRDVLLLATMYYADEVRSTAGLAGEETAGEQLHPNELKMAEALIANLNAEFQPERYQSDYRQALQELLAARAGEAVLPAAPPPGREKVVDLMEALRLSVQQTSRKKAPAGGGRRRGKETG